MGRTLRDIRRTAGAGGGVEAREGVSKIGPEASKLVGITYSGVHDTNDKALESYSERVRASVPSIKVLDMRT